jgi:hypothetical protein
LRPNNIFNWRFEPIHPFNFLQADSARRALEELNT